MNLHQRLSAIMPASLLNTRASLIPNNRASLIGNHRIMRGDGDTGFGGKASGNKEQLCHLMEPITRKNLIEVILAREADPA